MTEARGRHAGTAVWWARRWLVGSVAVLLAAGAAVAAVIAVAADAGPSRAEVRAREAKVVAAEYAAMQRNEALLLSYLSVTPAPGASGVALNAPVRVSQLHGALLSVRVVSPSGAVLPGGFAPGRGAWISRSTLQPRATYSVSVSVGGLVGGQRVTASRRTTFTTLTPTALVTASVFPYTGMSVGVGQPIVVYFDQPIYSLAQQHAVLSRFRIAESRPVPGGWYWFSDHELHFRPESFWPVGERISISANLDGWYAGSGEWGAGSLVATFSVGDARISYANLATEEMTVTLNGAVVATYPISGGRPEYPTMDGIHVVLDRESVVHMVSSTVGIPVNSPNGYNEYVYDDVHISDSGEYVHAAPWSIYAQGRQNVSHGCINLSPANALAFFDLSRVGDVVEVTGSPRPPVPGDHGVMDWTTPWSDWTPGHVDPM